MAYQGIDSRDLYRPGSGLTPRRLLVLLKSLPDDAPLMTEVRAEYAKSLKATPEQIRARADYYAQRAKEAD